MGDYIPYTKPIPEPSAAEISKFWAKVSVSGASACWERSGFRGKSGYCDFYMAGDKFRAHRVAYRIVKGEIPHGMVLDHECRNRACCNPTHLRVVTLDENTLAGVGLTAQNAKKTHCPKGHPLSGYNLVESKKGRQCRECKKALAREHYWPKYRERRAENRRRARLAVLPEEPSA